VIFTSCNSCPTVCSYCSFLIVRKSESQCWYHYNVNFAARNEISNPNFLVSKIQKKKTECKKRIEPFENFHETYNENISHRNLHHYTYAHVCPCMPMHAHECPRSHMVPYTPGCSPTTEYHLFRVSRKLGLAWRCRVRYLQSKGWLQVAQDLVASEDPLAQQENAFQWRCQDLKAKGGGAKI
jgi:hypothetical protein